MWRGQAARVTERAKGPMQGNARNRVGRAGDDRLMEFAVRRQRPEDDAAVRQVVTAAFGDRGRVADLAEALRARRDRQCSLVAVAGDRVVGHTHLSISWV